MAKRGFPVGGLKLALGPAFAALTWILMPVDPQAPAASTTAGVAIWMGVWWLTEAVPLAVTSLLPLVFFPVLGVLPAGKVAGLYTNDVVFLFIGGFIVALAMEKWNLHRRIALRVLLLAGAGPARTMIGFMAATALLSMWISNTAATMMMIPIAMAVLVRYDAMVDSAMMRRYSIGLLLGIAYSASIGGIATLVGTPPNLVFASLFPMSFPRGPEITFLQWMEFALPISILLFVAASLLLYRMYARGVKGAGEREIFRGELKEMGRMSHEEKGVLVVFLILAVLWVTRESIGIGPVSIKGWAHLLPKPGYIGDGTVAILVSSLLFVIPSRQRGEALMDWPTAKKLPWGIVLLFGGGFALAGAISQSGLSAMIGEKLQSLSSLPPIMMTAGISVLMTFTTELTSNTATTQMVLPILASVAQALGRNPFYLMIPATISASCAFMMPVATPPNAIIFGTGRLRIADMAKVGLILNLIGAVIITLWLHLIGPAAFGGPPMQHPSWMDPPAVEMTAP
ncbi:MAG: SLC13 family permease [bacterium]